MKNRTHRNIILLSLISAFLLIFNTIIKKQVIVYAESIIASFMLVIVFLSIQMYGYQKDKNNAFKNRIVIKISQILIIYLISIYLFGLYFGYSKIVFSLKLSSILNNTIAPMTIFLCLEMLRYIITNSNRDNKKYLIIFNIIFGIIELSVTTRYLSFIDFETGYKTIANYIIPISLKQVAFGLLCYYGGLKPLFLYRIFTIVYTYIIPIHPNFSETIICMCNIILPLILIEKVTTLVEEEKSEIKYNKSSNAILSVIPATLVIILVVLVSGITPLGITAIASNSMYPTFSKGSGIITMKVKNNNLEVGDIIAFTKNNKKIVHRIEKIELVANEKRYYTKGDANTSIDKEYVTIEEINGKILFSIPIIGYPTVILNELFSK